MSDSEHFMECQTCGVSFDMRDLSEVFKHEHEVGFVRHGCLCLWVAEGTRRRPGRRARAPELTRKSKR